MKIEHYKKLEKEITGYNFNKSYSNVNKIMTALSYFGHIASIFLAFFFMSGIISGATENIIVIFSASVVILVGLELLKRDIFDKFSKQSLKDRGIKNAIPLLIASCLLIFFSFYSTISGAKKFSSKADEIELRTREDIKVYTDSITAVYQPRIELLEDQNKTLFDENSKLNDEARELPANWVSAKERIRSNIAINNEQIGKNDERISNIKEERDNDIEKYESALLTEGDADKKENTRNSFLFVIISTLIEFVILGGVYFNEYFKFRSYREQRDILERDPNYQKWLLYDQILSIILTEETKMNEKLPSNKAIIDICKVNDIIVLPKDLSNFTKILNGLGIIKSSGSVKYITKTKEMAIQSLKRHFNII